MKAFYLNDIYIPDDTATIHAMAPGTLLEADKHFTSRQTAALLPCVMPAFDKPEGLL